jgi:hypothetical protein
MAGIFQKRGKAAIPVSGPRIGAAHDRKWGGLLPSSSSSQSPVSHLPNQ